MPTIYYSQAMEIRLPNYEMKTVWGGWLVTRFCVVLTVFLLLGLEGCRTLLSAEDRIAQSMTLIPNDWQKGTMHAGEFDLFFAANRQPLQNGQITVYLEGDGLAWISRSTPSDNPTPLNPVGLKLALAQPSGRVVYLGRVCQYVKSPACRETYWTGGRFAPEVICAMSAVLDSVKQREKASSIQLVGYSGGGAIAALLAESRSDVSRVITVAGNIDHRAWARFHALTPLDASMDPLLDTARLAAIPQVHFAGQNDEVVPPKLLEDYVDKLGRPAAVKWYTVEGQSHGCCWQDRWPQLWQRYLAN